MTFRGPRIIYPLYEARLARRLRGLPVPKHVAIMCDGNRRWARESGFTDVSHGHRVGAQKLVEVVNWCDELGVDTVTVWLLSTENLKRSKDEIDLLCDIIGDVTDDVAEQVDLVLRPLEVLRAQQPHGDGVHPELVTPVDDLDELLRADAVPVGDVGEPALPGPPPVAVAHDRHVLGHGQATETPGEPGFVERVDDAGAAEGHGCDPS